MFYSMYRSFQLIEENYDYVIRTRFDVDYSKFNLELPEEGIILPEWNTDIRVKSRGYYDVFALGKQEDMIVYSQVFPNIISYTTNDEDFLNFLKWGLARTRFTIKKRVFIKMAFIKK
jgi:hypothetical protein